MDAWVFWAPIIVTSIIVPTVGYVLVMVLKLQVKVAELEQKYTAIMANCKRHQEWSAELQQDLKHIATNVTQLCQKAGVPYVGT